MHATLILLPLLLGAGRHVLTSDFENCPDGASHWVSSTNRAPCNVAAPSPSISEFSPSSAVEGTTVTVTGRFPAPIASVRLGGSNVPVFSRLSESSLTLSVPASVSSGAISVTDTAGKTATSTDSLTITAGTVTGISVTDTTLPFGTGVQLAGSCAGTGTFDSGVMWSLAADPDGCRFLGASVTPEGYFSSPTAAQSCYPGGPVCNASGTCSVIATCRANAALTTTATVLLTAAPASSLVLSPSTASAVSGQTRTFTASGGTAPYDWEITTNGSTTATLSCGDSCTDIGASVIYTRGSGAGDDVIAVTDAAGSPATLSATISATVLAAFPGAQGAGAVSVGGRGGAVYRVTNVNDSGAGSLRACVEASGPRTCVFAVSGVINLLSALFVTNPYLTIAGQTAPGGGVAIYTGSMTSLPHIAFYVLTHDVVIRYLRVWGDFITGEYINGPSGGGGSYALQAWGGSSNLVLDHCSFLWQTGKSFGAWDAPGKFSVQWSLLGENVIRTAGLPNYPSDANSGQQTPTSWGVSAASSGTPPNWTKLADADLHHNVAVNSSHRFFAGTGSGRIVNNIIYNWRWPSAYTDTGGSVDWIGNYWKPGPYVPVTRCREILMSQVGVAGVSAISLYVSGNKSEWAGPTMAPDNGTRGTLSGAESDAVQASKLVAGSVCFQAANCAGTDGQMTTATIGGTSYTLTPPQATFLRTSPLATVGVAISATPVADLMSELTHATTGVGVGRLLDCAGGWRTTDVRDSAETRILGNVVNGTAPETTVTDQNSANDGTLPSITAGVACTDTDTDGIPDTFETAACDTTTCLDPVGIAADGYTNLERYLNGDPL